MKGLKDGFGRGFEYLRLSVDEACNFRCVYCLPEGYKRTETAEALSVAEVRRLVAAFAGLGLWKVRLTGGEPTTRQDIVELAAAVSSTPGVRALALSTNGYRLPALASDLARAGVGAVNVSIDSLDAGRFARITGRDHLDQAWAGALRCLDLGLKVKINAVLLRGLNDEEWPAFLELTRERPLSVRFIELMQTGDNAVFFAKRHLPATSLVSRLEREGWAERPRSPGDGPARAFRKAGYKGEVGVIAPYGQGFCSTCNRLRVTSRARLRLCLFAEEEYDLRPLLVSDGQKAQLQARVTALLGRKEASHYLPEGRTGGAKHLALMGG